LSDEEMMALLEVDAECVAGMEEAQQFIDAIVAAAPARPSERSAASEARPRAGLAAQQAAAVALLPAEPPIRLHLPEPVGFLWRLLGNRRQLPR